MPEFVPDPKVQRSVIHVLMPTRGAISVGTHGFLRYFGVWAQRSGFSQVHEHLPTGKPVIAAREECVDIVRGFRAQFPDKEHWALWCDDDMEPPQSSVAIMKAEIEASELAHKRGERPYPIGILSGLCCRKETYDLGMVFAPKTAVNMAPSVDYNPGDIVEVHWCGLGFALMRADWFEKLNKPYFDGNEQGAGEDHFFTNKLRDAGCIPYVHTGLNIGHFELKVQHSFFAYMPQRVRSVYDEDAAKVPVPQLRRTVAPGQLIPNGKVETLT